MMAMAKMSWKLMAAVMAIGLSGSPQAHELERGQQLTFVLSDSRPGGEQVGQTYFSQAFPMAQANGMRELTTFKVQKTLLGERTPQGSGLYLWPSREAAQRTRSDERYVKNLRPLRTQVWNELQSIDMQLDAPMRIELDRSKTYTAALIWVKSEAAFEQYLRSTQPLHDRAGVRTVLNLPSTRYENLSEGETTPPHRVLLLEWPTQDGPGSYTADSGFQSVIPQYEQAVAKIEWYQLGFWD
jgi:uncharacterized protein (DUF1330 family)